MSTSLDPPTGSPPPLPPPPAWSGPPFAASASPPRKPISSSTTPPGSPPPAPAIPPPPPRSGTSDEPYPSIYVLGAVIFAMVAPFLSLLVALVLRNDEKIPARKEQLTSWAVASGIWLAIGGIFFIAAVSSIRGNGA